MPKIDRDRNKKQFLEGMEAEYDKLEAMDAACFAHCGWQTYMNAGEKKKNGQDIYSSWYVGEGGSTNPPPTIPPSGGGSGGD